MWNILRKVLFYFDPETAHAFGALFLQIRGFLTKRNGKPLRLSYGRRFHLAGFDLDSPLGMAAGFDKDAKLLLGLRSLGFGFVEIGTVTLLPQKGNPKPRLFRLPESRALINRMGFNSEGAQAVAARLEYVRALEKINFPIGVNLGKNKETPLERAADDYVASMEILYNVSDYLVVNLSSPNTPGLTSLQEGDFLAPLLTQIREKRDRLGQRSLKSIPLFLKLSPDLTKEAREIAATTAISVGFEGLILSNTSRRRDFALAEGDRKVAMQEGGLSGAPLRVDALSHLIDTRALVGPKPILISVGGLGSAEDAKKRLELGANFLQVYTEFVYAGPQYPRILAKELAHRLTEG